MLYDPVSLTVLPPHGDPSPEARFREEYLNRPERKAAKPEAADPRLVEQSRTLREHLLARVGRFIA
jgi:hypothetical protein